MLHLEFLKQIEDLVEANGWSGLLKLEVISEHPPTIRVTLGSEHRTHPEDLVNDYTEGVHPFDQIQQECLRALRTGRTGL